MLEKVGGNTRTTEKDEKKIKKDMLPRETLQKFKVLRNKTTKPKERSGKGDPLYNLTYGII